VGDLIRAKVVASNGVDLVALPLELVDASLSAGDLAAATRP
jgi:hypothetical protein